MMQPGAQQLQQELVRDHLLHLQCRKAVQLSNIRQPGAQAAEKAGLETPASPAEQSAHGLKMSLQHLD